MSELRLESEEALSPPLLRRPCSVYIRRQRASAATARLRARQERAPQPNGGGASQQQATKPHDSAEQLQAEAGRKGWMHARERAGSSVDGVDAGRAGLRLDAFR